jgi:hypothetical protein
MILKDFCKDCLQEKETILLIEKCQFFFFKKGSDPDFIPFDSTYQTLKYSCVELHTVSFVSTDLEQMRRI